jgi:uncharacterized protein with HEPN domain
LARLEDMLAAIGRIERYAVEGRERFERDELVQVFFLHQLMILGEAASRVSPAFRDASSDLPWRQMMGLRNVLVHGYFAIEADTVWGVVERDLPPLKVQLQRLLGETLPE